MKKVAIVMGSDSDVEIGKKCASTLSELLVPSTVHVISAHRSPEEASAFARSARENGYGAIVAIAGKAAHLGGVLAAYTTLPVIAVPVSSKDLGGLDALLSSVQMPPGIPVATVAIDGGVNAAILACQIIAVSDDELQSRLEEQRTRMHEKVLEKDRQIMERMK